MWIVRRATLTMLSVTPRRQGQASVQSWPDSGGRERFLLDLLQDLRIRFTRAFTRPGDPSGGPDEAVWLRQEGEPTAAEGSSAATERLTDTARVPRALSDQLPGGGAKSTAWQRPKRA